MFYRFCFFLGFLENVLLILLVFLVVVFMGMFVGVGGWGKGKVRVRWFVVVRGVIED